MIVVIHTAEHVWLVRLGSSAAALGAICAGIGNLVHPVTPRDDPLGVAEVIADSTYWTQIHLVIMIGVVLMLAGLVALGHILGRNGLVGALTRLGLYAATIGVTVGLVTVVLDGVAAKQLAEEWSAAPGRTAEIALGLVSANETVNFALAALFNMTFAGVPFVLFGLAVALAGPFPRWLGWVAFAAGIFSIAAGVIQAVTGEPTTVSLILTIIGPTVISLWLLLMGFLMWRTLRKPEEPQLVP